MMTPSRMSVRPRSPNCSRTVEIAFGKVDQRLAAGGRCCCLALSSTVMDVAPRGSGIPARTGGDRSRRLGRQSHSFHQSVEMPLFLGTHTIDLRQRHRIAKDQNPRGPRQRRQVAGHRRKVVEVHAEMGGMVFEKLPLGGMKPVRMRDLR